MDEDIQKVVTWLEAEWSDGFLWKARQGIFDVEGGASFASRLERVDLPPDGPIDRRIVALLWYVPIFLEWQRDRVKENGGDIVAFGQLASRILNRLEKMLGIP